MFYIAHMATTIAWPLFHQSTKQSFTVPAAITSSLHRYPHSQPAKTSNHKEPRRSPIRMLNAIDATWSLQMVSVAAAISSASKPSMQCTLAGFPMSNELPKSCRPSSTCHMCYSHHCCVLQVLLNISSSVPQPVAVSHINCQISIQHNPL